MDDAGLAIGLSGGRPTRRCGRPCWRHLDALPAEPLPPVTLDGELVAKARTSSAGSLGAARLGRRIPAPPPPRRMSRRGGRANALGRGRRTACSSARQASRWMTASPASSPSTASTRCCCPRSPAPSGVALGSGCWRAPELDPNGPELRAPERDVIALYEADVTRKSGTPMLADLNVVPLRSLTPGGAGLLHPGLAAIADRDLLASAARASSPCPCRPPPPPRKAARRSRAPRRQRRRRPR